MSIEFKGLDEIQEKLESMLSAPQLEAAMGKACALVERSAQQKAPKTEKSSGDLRRSIKSRVENDGAIVKGIVFTTMEYAPYIEYGTGLFAEVAGRTEVPWHYQDEKGKWHTTSGMPPSPFMRPALDENREAIKRKLKGEILK